ncbi:ATP-binding protein [Pseudomonas monteilii]|uniref:ATP-binding protein n=1 Tax=Pseudomonas monteilii TaxID=76759 RepID=UPI001E2A47C3|nr:ATP-binding protein [Pseudomonas monteilii]MCE0877414.1 ATP-binding protein [Pseudomonas monteilii]MCE0929598.1 ATP-binding protein [Pseudomonas monteilii]MCE1015792.1 ATP-binding protein [Pseudomonas monteilii]MCE1044479.1 ATP-binding protein [Pseudomonas monteilii]WJR47620.1 ATP-binding protein [Pseudomonas monteilii]
MSRLLRIVLIDSLCAGDKAEVLVDANTCLTGTNGIGKSTFLKLIPLFYGASAGRMVKAGTNTSSFADHYLPSFTSYIVFEYMNHENVPRCAVLHRSSSGYAYRLISSPWDAELLYVDQTIGLLVEPSSLQRRAANMRIDCTPELTPRDYLRIIQYNTGLADLEGINSVDRKRMIAALRRAYSLAPFRHHFGGIDNLMFSLLESKGTFDSMKSAMKEILQQETGIEGVDLSGMDLGAFTGAVDSRASFLIMERQISPMIDRLSELHPRLVANEGQQGRLKRIAAEQLNDAQSAKTIVLEEIGVARKRELVATETHNEKNEALQDRLGNARRVEKDAVKDVQDLINQKEKFDQSIVPSLMKDYASMPALEEGLRALGTEHSILVEQGQGIQSRYEKLEAELARSVLERKQKRIQESETRQADVREKSQAQLDHLERQAERARDQHTLELEDHDKKHTALATALADLQTRAAFLEKLRFLPETTDAIQSEQRSVAVIRAEYDQAATEIVAHEAEQRRFALEQQAIAGEQQILVNRREELRDEVETLSRQLNPGEDTLLAFLRSECQAWDQSIGRVINPELLLRTDLSPSGTLDSSGLFGVQLDFHRLQPVAEADKELIESSLAIANQRLIDIEDEQQLLTRKTTVLLEQRKQHQSVLAEIHGRQNKHHENLKALQGLIATLEEEGKGKIAQERVECSHAAAEASRCLNIHVGQRQELRNSQLQHLANLKGIVQEVRQEASAQLGEIERLKVAALGALDQEQSDKLHAYTSARMHELTEAGVDGNAITKLEAEIDAIKTKLATLNDHLSDIRSYQLWLRDDLPKLPTLEAARLQASEVTSRIVDEARVLQESRSEQVRAFKAAQAVLAERQSVVESKLLILTSVLKRLENTPVVNSDLDSLRKLTPADIEGEVGRLQRDANSHRDEGRSLFRKIEMGIMAGPRDTAEYDAIQDIAMRARQADATGERAWFHATPELQIYMAEGHDVQRSKLITRVRTLCTQVSENQSVLNGLHRAIQDLGRKATKKVTEVLAAFPQFTNFEFRVVSRIHDISAWDEIDGLVEQYNRWRVKPAGEIPTDALNERLMAMQRRMKAGGLLSTKLADCFDVSLSWMVNGAQRVAFNTADLGDGLSTGQLKIIVGMIYQALFELIRRDADFDLLLPIDEALELDVNNAYTLLKYFNARNSQLMLGFPGGAPELIRHFTHLYALDRRPSGAVYVKQYQAPETDRLAELNDELELDDEMEALA